jgi:hypothetical protein
MALSRAEIIQILGTVYPFRKLDPAMIELVVNQSTLVEFAQNTVIYTENDPAKILFMVLEGNIAQSQGEDLVQTASLATGDIFGFESLIEGAARQTTATTTTSVSVLEFNQDQTIELMNTIPGLIDALELLWSSFRLSLKIDIDWLSPSENIYYVARRHTAFLFLRLLPPLGISLIAVPIPLYFAAITGFAYVTWLVVLGAIVLALGIWIGWEVLDWSNDYAIVTNQRVLFLERVVLLYDSRVEAPLSAVQGVNMNTTQIGRILHFGNVVIKTYAGSIVLPDLKSPEQVTKIVEAGWFRSGLARTKSEQAAIEQSLKVKLGYVPPPQPKPAGPVNKAASQDDIKKMLENMFRMRFEAGGSITYRKHWLKLILNIWGPTLILAALIVIMILSIVQVFTLLSIGAVLGLGFVLGIITSAWWYYQYLDWCNDYYVISDEQILDVYQKPFGNEERKAAPLKNIQSVSFRRKGLIGLIFNYGTVYIRVGESDLTFDDVFNPAEIQRELFKRLADRDYKEKQKAVAGEQQRLAEWLQIYDRVVRNSRNSNNPPL